MMLNLTAHTMMKLSRHSQTDIKSTKSVVNPSALAATVAVVAGLWLIGEFVRAPWACSTGAQASSEIGQHTCVTFHVSHIGTSWKGDVFLDEKTDYIQGFAVYVPSGSGVTLAQAQSYANKDVSVTGTITSYRGAPQIMASDPSQLQFASTWGSWVLAGSVLVMLVWIHAGWRTKVRAEHSQQDALVQGTSPLTPVGLPQTLEHEAAPFVRRQELDRWYVPALRTVHKTGAASTALLQYRLHIPYETAAYLIQRMEDERLVGPPDGARPRLVNTARLKQLLDSLQEGPANRKAAR